MTWPTEEDVERVALAIEHGTASGIQIARLCAMARNLVEQRAALDQVLTDVLTLAGPHISPALTKRARKALERGAT